MLFLCYVINVILYNYGVVNGERTKLPRYAFDVDLKPAIVGSYSYDMVKGKFILPDTNSSTTEINLTDIILNTTSNTTISDDSYRKHVGIAESKPMFKWWTHSKLLSSNSTNPYKKLFKGRKIAIFTTPAKYNNITVQLQKKSV